MQNNENKTNKSSSLGLVRWLKGIYGLEDNQKQDLDFVYTSYSYANEKPAKLANTLFIIIVLIFTSFILWASLAEIDELARGEGKVIPSDKIQKIQSFDGGVISEILVKEGEIVDKGAPLLKIDTTRFQASFEENKQSYLSLLAVRVRLEAESKIDLDKPTAKLQFPKEILDNGMEYAKTEENLLESRTRELKSSVKVLKNQLEQKNKN